MGWRFGAAKASRRSSAAASLHERFSGTAAAVSISREKRGKRKRVRKKRRRFARARTRTRFTLRHQRNCMRGNKQNYKARRSGLLFRKFSPAILPHAISPSFLSLCLISLRSVRLPLFLREELLADSSTLLPLRLQESRNARVRVTHTPTRPQILTGCILT